MMEAKAGTSLQSTLSPKSLDPGVDLFTTRTTQAVEEATRLLVKVLQLLTILLPQ